MQIPIVKIIKMQQRKKKRTITEHIYRVFINDYPTKK